MTFFFISRASGEFIIIIMYATLILEDPYFNQKTYTIFM